MIRTIAAALAAFALISFGARAEDAAAAPAGTEKKATKTSKKAHKKAKKAAKKADAPATTDTTATPPAK